MVSSGRAFLAQRTAGAKALRSGRAWFVQGAAGRVVRLQPSCDREEAR